MNYKSKFECDKGTCIALRRVVPIPVLGNTSLGSEFGICNMVRLLGYGEQRRFSMLTGKRGEVAWDPRPSWGFYQLGVWSSIYQWNSGFNINLYPYSTTNIEAQFLSQYLEVLEPVLLNSIPSSFFLLFLPPSFFPLFLERSCPQWGQGQEV